MNAYFQHAKLLYAFRHDGTGLATSKNHLFFLLAIYSCIKFLGLGINIETVSISMIFFLLIVVSQGLESKKIQCAYFIINIFLMVFLLLIKYDPSGIVRLLSPFIQGYAFMASMYFIVKTSFQK